MLAKKTSTVDSKVLIRLLLASALLLLILPAATSCGPDIAQVVSRSVVRVRIPASTSGEAPLDISSGVVVGDGNQVLMLPDYVEYTPGPLEVVTADGATYPASVQAIDPRTGLTVLALDGDPDLPVATFGSSPSSEQKALAWDWTDSGLSEEKDLLAAPGSDTPDFFFGLHQNKPIHFPAQIPPGTVVTDDRGRVLGISTISDTGLVLVQGMHGLWIARTDNLSELLRPDATDSTWAKGPSLSMVGWPSDSSGSSGGGAAGIYGVGILTSASDYDRMTLALESLTSNLGSPVATSGLDLNNPYWYFSIEGFMFVGVYPRPVELKSVDGGVLASAKWIGVQWGRSEGKPNRLVYGAKPYLIDGGYEILGDISQLAESVTSMATTG